MTTPEVQHLLAATGEAIARLAERVKRMEEREAAMEALLREIKGKPVRRKFRAPLDLGKVAG